MHTGFWWGNVRERDHLEGTVIYREIILKWIFRKSDVGHGLDLSSSWYGQVVGSCECVNEPYGSIKCEEFLD
jgi:hypothetical protein